MSLAADKPYVRLLQISLGQDDLILLAKLALKRTEQDQPPRAVTKSALIAEAIRALAAAEGIPPAAETEG